MALSVVYKKMVIILKEEATKSQVQDLVKWVESLGLSAHLSKGESSTILGLIGDTTLVDIGLIRSLDIVENVMRVTEPFKNAHRKFHPQDTIVDLGGGVAVGGGHWAVMAGPCSIENETQLTEIAEGIIKGGARILRGGAFKPRSSPYSFQGMRKQGIDLLLQIKAKFHIPVVTEIMSETHLDMFQDIDLIQVGARNMQNFELLKELSRTKKPILLKRGLSNTIQEWLMSAEYILSGGNPNVILCERGIRTFEQYTRNTLDISSVPLVHELSHLPIIVDPSHASGTAKLVPALSKAATACGADGLMIEVHNHPSAALCDGEQSITPDQFEDLMGELMEYRAIVEKSRHGGLYGA